MHSVATLFAFVVLLPCALARSLPETTSCDVADPALGVTAMNWATPPAWSDKFTVRTGDTADKSQDQKTYAVGMWVPIYVRTLSTEKITGFMLYATDSSGQKVGEFDIPATEPPGMFYMPDNCLSLPKGGQTVMHTSVQYKNYVHIFYWRTLVNVGTVTFQTLIKTGAVQEGGFFWPKSSGKKEFFQLTPTVDFELLWVVAEPGQSCTEHCASVGKTCSEGSFTDADIPINTPVGLEKQIKESVPCQLPYLLGGHASDPSTGASNDCFYPAPSVTPTCDAVPPAVGDEPAEIVTRRRLLSKTGAGRSLLAEQCRDDKDWRDHDKTCGPCKNLVDAAKKYKTCDKYCESMAMKCTGAWEDGSGNTCDPKAEETCSTDFDKKYDGTGDMICACEYVISDGIALVDADNSKCDAGSFGAQSPTSIWVDDGCDGKFECSGGKSFKCESKKSKTTCQCNQGTTTTSSSTAGGLEVKQISSTACVAGTNYGAVSPTTIFVDKGCRLIFWCGGRQGNDDKGEKCESNKMKREECECPEGRFVAATGAVNIPIMVGESLSKAPCEFGVSFFVEDTNTMKATMGCRANFKCGDAGDVFKCESQDKEDTLCGCRGGSLSLSGGTVTTDLPPQNGIANVQRICPCLDTTGNGKLPAPLPRTTLSILDTAPAAGFELVSTVCNAEPLQNFGGISEKECGANCQESTSCLGFSFEKKRSGTNLTSEDVVCKTYRPDCFTRAFSTDSCTESTCYYMKSSEAVALTQQSRLSCEELNWELSPADPEICASSFVCDQCSGMLLADEAEKFCSRVGARLCLPAELESNVAWSSGCRLNAKRVWTDVSCEGGGRVSHAGSLEGLTSLPSQCEPFGVRLPARCCATRKDPAYTVVADRAVTDDLLLGPSGEYADKAGEFLLTDSDSAFCGGACLFRVSPAAVAVVVAASAFVLA